MNKTSYAVTQETRAKLERLKAELKSLGSVLVAFSGGVDSSFLLKVAHDTLGVEKTLAVTARSSTYPQRELDNAISVARLIGARHMVIDSEELDIEGFSKNPVNRCYYCKGELFGKLTQLAAKEGFSTVLDGANADDARDHRPGSVAALERGVRSLLRECGIAKNDIRALSHEMGLPTWNKPAFACLASRFPYGDEITRAKLGMVEKAEYFLRDMGFTQLRVRNHSGVARIELASDEMAKAVDADTARKIHDRLKEIGFKYVALDLLGYRTGSMNETLGLSGL
ncbi:MAG: ATP-dependent sacrificial sulfur transferase LarE [Nitrospinae bacterium]|nr:ATP-dependent sacrificial sulfur transferase LarE [Nitrospinota bacterium]